MRKRWLLSVVSPGTLEAIGLWMIIGGLGAEAALIVDSMFFEVTPSKLEKGLTVLSTIAIALGVFIEHVGGSAISAEQKRLSDEKIAALQLETAISNLELAKLKAPRSISPEQRAIMKKVFKEYFPAIQFDVAFDHGDREQWQFLPELESALADAGWVQVDWPDGPITRYGTRAVGLSHVSGVIIQVDETEKDRLWGAATSLKDAVTNENVYPRVEIGITVKNTNKTVLHILVGRK